MAARLLLICHASTDALRRSAFPADEALDHRGREKAAALAGSLPPPDRCWTGPELRTRQTAETLGLDAQVDVRLRDCDYGTWTGRSLDEVNGEDAGAVARWLGEPAASPHGGESLVNLIGRVAAWLHGLEAASGRAIAVTHPAVIRAAIVVALEATPRSFWRIDIAPLSVTRLSGDRGRWNLRSLESGQKCSWLALGDAVRRPD
jgi:broad specificity phosphatase PhoE